MKRVKRLLCVLLTMCMVFGLLPTTVFSVGDMPFTDVKTTDWFYSSIQYVYENGMMYGLGDTVFSPGTTTTRGMIVTEIILITISPWGSIWRILYKTVRSTLDTGCPEGYFMRNKVNITAA